MTRLLALLSVLMLSACATPAPDAALPASPAALPLDQWTYIEVDSTRGMWGDTDEPSWLRYFGLDMADFNGDDQLDIVSGRYIYLSPGGDLTASWSRIDLEQNVDGILAPDVDGDDRADIIALALPDVYWFEATDATATAWTGRVVATGIARTGHVNSQGFLTADVFAGGKPEVLIAGNNEIFALTLPDAPDDGDWPVTRIAGDAYDEGIDVGDADGDGDLDLFGARIKDEAESTLFWWENPGTATGDWTPHQIGKTPKPTDRVVTGDFNGDGRLDLAISEERYPGLEPDASIYVFTQTDDGWNRQTLVTQFSTNNLDAADIDQDGDLDLVSNEHKGSVFETEIWENDGAASFTPHVIDTGKESHLGTQFADLDGDGDLDLVSAAWDQHQYLHVWRNDAR
ncbi:MAG: VCBS repeat-containing protein [Bacteroidota bacterium]